MGEQDSDAAERLTELASTMSTAAQTLSRQGSTEVALAQIVALALASIPTSEHAGVTLVRGKGFVTAAASDELPEQVDTAQYGLREGPCVDAATRDAVFRGDDLEVDDRWPRFAPFAVSLGVRSMLAVPLFEDVERRGALNLYAAAPHAFDEQDEAVAVIFAAQASLTLSRNHERESAHQFEQALDSSRVIGTAVGVLMGSHGLTDDQAMQLLRTASQRLNRKVSDLAESIVYTGELPS